MKTFFAVFAAILCAAVLIIGYLRAETRFDDWRARKSETLTELKDRDERCASLRQEMVLDPRDADSAQDALDRVEAERCDLQTSLAALLRQKPVLPLTGEEKQLMASADAGVRAYELAHTKTASE